MGGLKLTNSDFVVGSLATANTEAKVGTLAVPGGATIKQITFANRAPAGLLYAIRLDYAGIRTPKKWLIPSEFDATGTEVEYEALWPADAIDVSIKLPSNTSTVDIYATADTNSTTVAVGLVWI